MPIRTYSHPFAVPQKAALLALLAVSSLPSLASAADTAPDWAKDVVWYQIFPERFANGDPSNDPTRDTLTDPDDVPANWAVMDWTGDWYARADWEKEKSPWFHDTVYHRRYGGDLQGVIDRLDYLKELGVTGLYFNPVFYADSLHKYDGNSFHHIDPYFGPDPEGDLALMEGETDDPATWKTTAADRLFIRLLQEAKARGMRVILDGVWNHTGRDFFAFEDIRERQAESPYKDWYHIIRYDDPATPENEFDYHGWWGFKSLPEFANGPNDWTLAEGPKRYIFNATRRWMDPNLDGDPSDGIDGWRLDVAEEVPPGFWQEWHALVREINPEAFTSAEIWKSSADFIRGGRFSSAMNYDGFAVPVKGWLIDGRIGPTEFAKRLQDARQSQDPATAHVLQNLVDSHDTQRLGSAIANRNTFRSYHAPHWFDYDESKRVNANAPGYVWTAPGEDGRRIWKMVALFQATYVGAPMIYYGSEAGMIGADDPDDRMPMVWPDLDYAPRRIGPDNRPLPEAESVAFDRELFEAYQSAFQLRHAHPALRRGEFRVLGTDDQADLLVFERSLDGERLVVALNRSEQPLALDNPLFQQLELVHATDPEASAQRLPRLSAAVYRPKAAPPQAD